MPGLSRREWLSIALTTGITTAVSGCTEEISSGDDSNDNDPDVDEIKEMAEEVEYDTLNRNYEDHIGDYVYYPDAEISVSNQKDEGYSYNIYINGDYDRAMWVRYNERFLEGDWVEFWGEVMEIENVQNEP